MPPINRFIFGAFFFKTGHFTYELFLYHHVFFLKYYLRANLINVLAMVIAVLAAPPEG
jgi:hypothetical protein